MTALAAVTLLLAAVPAVRAALVDRREHRLPNRLVAQVAAVALIGLVAAALIGGEPGRLVGVAGGAASFAGWWLLCHLVSPRLVGFGDVKYAAALGLLLGWFGPWWGLTGTVVATLLAAPEAVFALIRGEDRSIVLGPYLLAATILLAAIGWRLAIA